MLTRLILPTSFFLWLWSASVLQNCGSSIRLNLFWVELRWTFKTSLWRWISLWFSSKLGPWFLLAFSLGEMTSGNSDYSITIWVLRSWWLYPPWFELWRFLLESIWFNMLVFTVFGSFVPKFVPEVPAPDAGGLGPLADEFLRLKKPESWFNTPFPILLPSRDLLAEGFNLNGLPVFFWSECTVPMGTGIKEAWGPRWPVLFMA